MQIAAYDTALADAEWAVLRPLLPQAVKVGRPATDRRRVIDAILHILSGGIAWWLQPKSFPPWQTVYRVFRKWTKDNTWERLNDRLRSLVRKTASKDCRPTAAILDSQRVKSAPHGGVVGNAAAKKIKWRKRHLEVDTLVLVLGVLFTPANVTEWDGAKSQ